jgi:hypothetical protein
MDFILNMVIEHHLYVQAMLKKNVSTWFHGVLM